MTEMTSPKTYYRYLWSDDKGNTWTQYAIVDAERVREIYARHRKSRLVRNVDYKFVKVED